MLETAAGGEAQQTRCIERVATPPPAPSFKGRGSPIVLSHLA